MSIGSFLRAHRVGVTNWSVVIVAVTAVVAGVGLDHAHALCTADKCHWTSWAGVVVGTLGIFLGYNASAVLISGILPPEAPATQRPLLLMDREANRLYGLVSAALLIAGLLLGAFGDWIASLYPALAQQPWGAIRVTSIVNDPAWRCWYFVIAFIASCIYGIFAFQIHRAPLSRRAKAEKVAQGETLDNSDIYTGWPRAHQHWFNFLGSMMGWLAGWVVLNRWLACPTFMCADEPRFATAVLAVGAFVGMTGYIPSAIMSGVAALKAVVETYFNKLTGLEKAATSTTAASAANEGNS
jgi:hypothetical protein